METDHSETEERSSYRSNLFAMLGMMFMFYGLMYIPLLIGHPLESSWVDWHWIVCYVMMAIVYKYGAACLTMTALRFFFIKQSEIFKCFVLIAFIIPAALNILTDFERVYREVDCYTQDSQKALSDVLDGTRSMYEDMERDIYRFAGDLTENEGIMIEKILERTQGLNKIKESFGKLVTKMSTIEERCKKKLLSFSEKHCYEAFSIEDDHLEERPYVFRSWGKYLMDIASNVGCEKLNSVIEKKEPCTAPRRLMQKMKKFAKKKARQTVEPAGSEDVDTFDFEFDTDFTFSVTNNPERKITEAIRKYIEHINNILNILLYLKELVAFLSVPLICVSSLRTIYKYKNDPSYCNTTITEIVSAIDKEERRKVLPLRPSERDRFKDTLITFNWDIIKKNKYTIILLFIPFILEIGRRKFLHGREGFFVPQELFEGKEFKACYEMGEELEGDYPWSLYHNVVLLFVVSFVLEAFLSTSLEIFLLDYHYPHLRKIRADWILNDIEDFRRRHRKIEKQTFRNFWEKLVYRFPWPYIECYQCNKPMYFNRNYCEFPLCSVLLCSTCITKPCKICKSVKAMIQKGRYKP